MTSRLTLSICIATWNRAHYLSQLLDSLKGQVNEEVEVVVSDNASTDDTQAVASAAGKSFAHFLYHRNAENIGAERNFESAVRRSRGRYCWIVGDDDVVEAGAVDTVLQALRSGDDIYLGDRTTTDVNMAVLQVERWLDDPPADGRFVMQSARDLAGYFHKARSIGAVFSYVSVFIFSRERWDRVTLWGEFVGTGYAHAAVCVSILAQGATLTYLGRSIVLCRLGNDSFAQDGYGRRFMLDVEGYYRIGHLVPESARAAFLHIVKREKDWLRIAKARVLMTDGEWQQLRDRLDAGYGYNRSGLAVVDRLLYVKSVLMALEAVRGRVRWLRIRRDRA